MTSSAPLTIDILILYPCRSTFVEAFHRNWYHQAHSKNFWLVHSRLEHKAVTTNAKRSFGCVHIEMFQPNWTGKSFNLTKHKKIVSTSQTIWLKAGLCLTEICTIMVQWLFKRITQHLLKSSLVKKGKIYIQHIFTFDVKTYFCSII